MSRSKRVRIGALMWAVQPAYLVVEVVVAAAAVAPYSFLDNTISDLGARTCTSIAYPYGAVPVCSPWHALLNGSFVVFGVLLAAGAVLIRRGLPRSRAAGASVALWIVAGLGSIGTGLVPLDQNLELHVLVSTPTFVAQPLALIALGVALRPRAPGLGWSALALGAVSAAATLAFLGRADSAEFGGLLERLALWPAYIWLPALAWAVTRPRR